MEENTPRPAGRPVVGTAITLKLSEATLAMPPVRTKVGIGQVYKDKATGGLWTLSGLRSGRTVILERGGEFRDRVSLDALADHYEHAGCDHENHCCPSHRLHVSPHRGCVMR